MKKFFILSAVMCLGLSAKAQYQLPNGDFEGGTEDCYPWEKGAKTTTAKGTQPVGWCTSNVNQSLAGEVSSEANGVTGKAVKLTNVDALGNGIPAYMTLGTTWATAESKGTSTRNKDGGVFGGISFTHHPDAVRFQYIRSSEKSTDESTVSAYLWKGTWSQEKVPSNTAIGVFSWGTATTVTMTDRDVNITGESTTTILGGTVSKTSDAELIAYNLGRFTDTKTSWTTYTLPLTYSSDATPEKLCITISASGYQATSSSTITKGTSITIDNVELVYYSGLKSATYNGTPIRVSPTLPGTINSTYDDSKLQIVSTGRAATIEKSYDAYSGLLTVTIKGENISEDPTNYSTFKFQFTPSMDVNNSGNVTISDVTKAVDDANSGNASATTTVISNIANAVLEK